MEHLADAFIPRLSHKSTMEPLTQTTWDFYLNNDCTKAAVSGSATPWAKSAIQLFSMPLSQKNHSKSMFMNFPQNWHTEDQTNIVKLCQHSIAGTWSLSPPYGCHPSFSLHSWAREIPANKKEKKKKTASPPTYLPGPNIKFNQIVPLTSVSLNHSNNLIEQHYVYSWRRCDQSIKDVLMCNWNQS